MPIAADARVSALATALPAGASRTWVVGTLQYTVTRIVSLDTKRLAVWLDVRKSGVLQSLPKGALPFIFVNPPVLIGGIEDPAAALKSIVQDTVRRYVTP